MGTFFKDEKRFKGQTIVTFGSYKPYSWHTQIDGGSSSNYPEYSGKILDLKEGKQLAVDYFYEHIKDELMDGFAIAIVPSHDPEKITGIKALAQKLAKKRDRVDASDCLVRTKKVEKLAHGGDRSIDGHFASIKVRNPDLIKGRNVLLLDDVTRTGNSLMACRKLLLDAGAKSVQCVALGKTG